MSGLRVWMIAAAVFLPVAACGAPPEPVSVSFFYLPACPTCAETMAMEQIAGELIQLGRENSRMNVAIHDVRNLQSAEALRRMANDRGENVRSLQFPVLFVDSQIHAGLEAVEAYLESR